MLRVDVWGHIPTVDLGLSVYEADGFYLGKSDVYDDGITGPAISWESGPGEVESVTFVVGDHDWYAFAVWKVDASDRADSTVVNMLITDLGVSATEEQELPAAIRLAGVYPNPLNPQTTVAFELNTPQRVKLEVFDLRGRLVRVLTEESLPAGRHERTWQGRDTKGRGVASGVYVIRMTAGRTTEMTRVSLLK